MYTCILTFEIKIYEKLKQYKLHYATNIRNPFSISFSRGILTSTSFVVDLKIKTKGLFLFEMTKTIW